MQRYACPYIGKRKISHATRQFVLRHPDLHVLARHQATPLSAYSCRIRRSEAVFSIAENELLEGAMPPRQTRLIQAWIEIHREELMADWTLAIRGETLVKIEPLR